MAGTSKEIRLRDGKESGYERFSQGLIISGGEKKSDKGAE